MADDGSKKLLGKSTSPENVRRTNVLPGALFLTGVTLASMVGGFGYAIGQARRRSPGSFDQRQQEGVKLAVRALGWGTVLAVSGVGLLVFGVKTALGVKDVRERVISFFLFYTQGQIRTHDQNDDAQFRARAPACLVTLLLVRLMMFNSISKMFV